MSNIKLRTAAGGSITLTPENTASDVTLTVPGDNSTLVSAADIAASGGSSLVGYQPSGTGAVATTVQTALRATPGDFGDYSVDNNLFIFCGDSTTEQMGAAGYGFDRLTVRRNLGEKWEKVLGTINFGGSGYTINGFVNDPAGTLPVVSTSNLGVGQWDYFGHKPTGAVSLATSMAWRAGKADRVTWVLCFGINDCILYAAIGNLSQAEISNYIAERLHKAVTTIQNTYPQDKIVLRVPNPMTARPYNAGAGYPSAAQYPSFGFNLAADQALVEKWNQGIRNAYLAVRNRHPGTILFDTWDKVFGQSDTTLTAGTQLPFLGDLVHPSGSGYIALAEALVTHLSSTFKGNPSRRAEATLRAAALSVNPWEVYPNFFLDNLDYKLLFDTKENYGLISIGSNYIDISIPLARFNLLVDTTKPLYISIGGKAAQKFDIGYYGVALGSNTRLLSVSPSASMQAAAAGSTVFFFHDAVNAIQYSSDDYVNTQVINKREVYPGNVAAGGNGYIDITFDNLTGRVSSKFRDGLRNGTVVVGGGVNTTLALSDVTDTYINGVPSQRTVRFLISGNYSTWAGKKCAIYFDDSVPSPKAFEDVAISGTTSATPGTQTAHAHGLGYVPSRVQLLPTSNGVIYQSANPDATNIYVKGSASSLTFTAYVK